ncbi:MAG: ABC transporter substrate-binding protein [Rothia sp. (in: high G+C Gram-positive bacteria)]|nr:ABC transporter substrate-binding protein [Rothia sp. (in: high G+C Gram-positive bacteria)]
MKLSRAHFLQLSLASAAASLLSACSTGSKTESGQAAPSTSDASFTVKHAFGETVFDSVPQRIAVVQPWKNPDVLLAFGIVPVGTPKVSWGQNEKSSTDWFDAKLAELGGNLEDITRYDETDGPNYEELAKLNPDAIFVPYGDTTQETYDKLTAIAPVVPAPEGVGAYETSWQQCVEMAGIMLQRQDDATQIIADLEQLIKEKTAEHPNLSGASFIAGYFDAKQNTFGAYTSEDSRPQFFESLGMVNAPYIEQNQAGAESVFLNISSEVLDSVECDVLWAWTNAAEEEQEVRNNELFAQMPALKNDAVIFESDKKRGLALSAASPLSVAWALEDTDILSQLSAAVGKSKAAS